MTDIEKLDAHIAKIHRHIIDFKKRYDEPEDERLLKSLRDELKRLREENNMYRKHWENPTALGITTEPDEYIEEPKRIDWSRMPRCRVEYNGDMFWFAGCAPPDRIRLAGYMDATAWPFDAIQLVYDFNNVKLLPDLDWRPWLGGECPVPEGVIVMVRRRNVLYPEEQIIGVDDVFWVYEKENLGMDIIQWKITGLADGFTI